MPKNLVVCCDGTNNQFGVENTNVVRLVQVLHRHADEQIVYYDPGVGTLPEPGFFTGIGKRFSKIWSLAFGTGLTSNVLEAYTFLMQNWRRGDRVFLFGFSRGAYTVRVLAGLLHQLGLLPCDNHNLLPYVLRLFQDIRSAPMQKAEDHSRADSWYWALCDEFRYTFARPVVGGQRPGDAEGAHDRRFSVHFLGVWDTVSSVGWVWNPATYPFTARNPSISVIRHAVSLDERRWFFRQNQIYPAHAGQDVKEYWFAGVHADVGGGYPRADGSLWRPSFEWMLQEAQAAKLLVDSERLSKLLEQPPVSTEPWSDQAHESLTLKWWIAEFVPKFQSKNGTRSWLPRIGLFGRRYVPNQSLIHHSALLRIQKGAYAPPNLSQRFRDQVRGLADVPEAIPSQW